MWRVNSNNRTYRTFPSEAKISEAGFNLLEVSIGLTLLIVGLIPLSSVMLHSNQGLEQVAVQNRVLAQARGLLEQVRSTSDPDDIVGAYHGNTYTVAGVSGSYSGGAALSVNVDNSNTKLLQVTINGSWVTNKNATETLAVSTQIYNPNG